MVVLAATDLAALLAHLQPLVHVLCRDRPRRQSPSQRSIAVTWTFELSWRMKTHDSSSQVLDATVDHHPEHVQLWTVTCHRRNLSRG
jgi:hypothetical protein